MMIRSLMRAGAPVLVLTMGLVACGSDDNASTPTTEELAGGDNEELCALAQEMFDQEDFPSAAQLQKYTDLAPDEVSAAVAVAAPPLIAADQDPNAFFNAVAEDDVTDAILELDAWELENCGIDHESARAPGQAEIDPGAARVDVVASEYTFAFDTELTAGRTSFVMTNGGKEVHFMVLSQLADGHTLDEALAYEGDPEAGGLVTGLDFESGFAAVGGDDEEVLTVDLPAGNWAMLCFVSGPDGTPHAFSGMAVPFTVT